MEMTFNELLLICIICGGIIGYCFWEAYKYEK